MGPTCGQDCFVCHDVNKLNDKKHAAAHRVIMESCMSCHKDLAKETLQKSIFNQGVIQHNFFHPKEKNKRIEKGQRD